MALKRSAVRFRLAPPISPVCRKRCSATLLNHLSAAAKVEVEEDEVVAPAGVELVSLDEVEASEEKAAEPAVEEVDVEETEAEPDDPFIEAEEEDEDDVTNLIDGDIAPDEEP